MPSKFIEIVPGRHWLRVGKITAIAESAGRVYVWMLGYDDPWNLPATEIAGGTAALVQRIEAQLHD